MRSLYKLYITDSSINNIEELNGKGEIIAEEIPYLSFFMPRSMFRDSISAVQR